MSKLESLIKQSCMAHQMMVVDQSDDASTRWENKKVYERFCLYHSDTLENVSLNGLAKIDLSTEMTMDNHCSLYFVANTKVENVHPRPFPNIKIKLDNLNLTAYNRVSLKIYPRAVGHNNFYFHFAFGNTNEQVVHAPSLTANMWNTVLFEVEDVPRDKVEVFTIQPFLMGCPPEGKELLEVFISDIYVEKVEADDVETWELGERIAYSHSGYYTNMPKTAIVKKGVNPEFVIFDELNQIVYRGIGKEVINSLGEFLVLDFSSLVTEGNYQIVCGEIQSAYFEISKQPLLCSIWKSMNFLRMLRCGEDVPFVHSHCHLNCKSVDSLGRMVPNFGGWHDAGDLSQFEIPTAEMTQALCDLAFKYQKDERLFVRIKEEAKIGLIWLLRTRFGNGERALAVSYGIWRDNLLDSDNESIKISKAENGPFENLLAAGALAVGARLFEDEPVFSDWCKRAAMEDFDFGIKGYEQGLYTLRWGPSIDSQVAGAAMTAASELYILTKDEKYCELVGQYGDIVMACQQKETPDWQVPLKGFFYEDPYHKYILSYEHRGHEQNPIQGLARAYEVFIEHPKRLLWQASLELYAQYVTDTMKYTYPYRLLPAHVYPLDKLNIERFTVPASYGTKEWALEDLKEQARNGIYLNDDVYLRIFPVAIQRRGYHATLLSKTKAVSMIGRVLNRADLKEIAYEQLAWVLGKNPFSSSTMYGEGHNFHPLYVAFSPQLVGALPVGIKTLGHHDKPYWPTVNNAVFKEIWGHTTGKYLWILADLD